MGLGQMLGPGEWRFGEMMGTMANGHLEIWRIWSKRTLGANGHWRQMGTWAHGHRAHGKKALGANGQRNKWGLGANWLLGKINIWVKWAPGEMGTRANGHFGKMDIRGKRVGYPKSLKGEPLVSCVHFPKCLHMATVANGH